jgi:hypothetical protein
MYMELTVALSMGLGRASLGAAAPTSATGSQRGKNDVARYRVMTCVQLRSERLPIANVG